MLPVCQFKEPLFLMIKEKGGFVQPPKREIYHFVGYYFLQFIL